MGSTNLQHSLKKKFSVLTGELVEVRARIKLLHREREKLTDLETRALTLESLIEAATALLKDIAPDWTPEQTAPVRPRAHTLPIPYGSCGRRAMDVLRRAGGTMTVRQIAIEIIREAGIDVPEPKVLQRMQNAIDASLRAHRGKGVEASDTYPAQWRTMAKTEIAFDP